jgi:hypothetical protein
VAAAIRVTPDRRHGLEERSDGLCVRLPDGLGLPAEQRPCGDAEQTRRVLDRGGEQALDLEDPLTQVRRVVGTPPLRQLVQAGAQELGDLGE